jgi:hypothetical protein
VREPPEPVRGLGRGAQRLGVGPGGGRRGAGVRASLLLGTLEPPGRRLERGARHLAGVRHAIEEHEEVRDQLGMRARRVEVASVERPGAGVEELRPGPDAGGVGEHRDVAATWREPIPGAAREITAALPVAAERGVEQRALCGREAGLQGQHGAHLVGRPLGPRVLERHEHAARIEETEAGEVQGSKSGRSKSSTVQYSSAGEAVSSGMMPSTSPWGMFAHCFRMLP